MTRSHSTPRPVTLRPLRETWQVGADEKPATHLAFMRDASRRGRYGANVEAVSCRAKRCSPSRRCGPGPDELMAGRRRVGHHNPGDTRFRLRLLRQSRLGGRTVLLGSRGDTDDYLAVRQRRLGVGCAGYTAWLGLEYVGGAPQADMKCSGSPNRNVYQLMGIPLSWHTDCPFGCGSDCMSADRDMPPDRRECAWQKGRTLITLSK